MPSGRVSRRPAARVKRGPCRNGALPQADALRRLLARAALWAPLVCQDQAHRDEFLTAAGRRPNRPPLAPLRRTERKQHYPGRRRILFACDADAHAGILEARRVPGYPPGHRSIG